MTDLAAATGQDEDGRTMHEQYRDQWQSHPADCPARAGSVYFCECGADPTRARGPATVVRDPEAWAAVAKAGRPAIALDDHAAAYNWAVKGERS
jgi:hypothetical protein